MFKFLKKKIKLVKQRNRYECSVACLSMITGCEYYKILNAIKEISGKNCGEGELGLHVGYLPQILKDKFNIKSEQIKFESFKKIKHSCILSLCPRELSIYSNFHGVVYDRNNKVILDPLIDEPIKDIKKYMKNYNIINCLEVINV